ncbi:MAG: hypothetical protein RBR20_10825 [Desulfobacterales bacterium]|jgi:hypothetical protein|nr:hypothetical protein [Desulfobacteraceae bacterium]MDY0312605.1 hypothetical protein [Desulfobacterales bacterium]
MNHRQNIASFTLSDKIKSGLIWASTACDQAAGFEGLTRQGAVAVAENLLSMVLNETVLVRQASGNTEWDEAMRLMDKARVMIRSGVPAEASFHLTRALSVVTSIGRQAGEALRQQGLL